MALKDNSSRRSVGRCWYLYEDNERCIYEGNLVDHLCDAHFTILTSNRSARRRQEEKVLAQLRAGIWDDQAKRKGQG